MVRNGTSPVSCFIETNFRFLSVLLLYQAKRSDAQQVYSVTNSAHMRDCVKSDLYQGHT
jgi:hypothetical protein